MSSFVLKIIALITMTIDHLGYTLFGKITYFNYIGRIAFPIFAFQISEGYINTKNLKKYFFKLFVFALISQIPYMLFESFYTDQFSLNIFFTLLLGLTSILIYDKCENKFLGILSGISIATISEITHCDYGFFGVAIILLFYIFKDSKIKLSISFIIAVVLKFLIRILTNGFYIEYIYLMIGTLLTLLFILLYNKKKGKSFGYFLYIFYPVHLLSLYGLHFLIK